MIGPNLYDNVVLPKLLGARALVLVLALVLALGQFRRGAISWRFTPLDIPLALFLISAAVSTVYAVNTSVALHGLYQRYQGLFDLVTYFALFWLAVQTVCTRRDAWLLIRSLIVAGYAVSVVAIVQVLLGSVPLLGLPLSSSSSRPDATFANPTLLGAFLAMLLPLALYELLHSRSLTDRILFANATVVMGLGMVLSLTRSAWIGAVIGMGVVLISWHPRRAAILLGGVTAVAAVSVAGALLFNRLGGHITAPGPVQAVISRAQSLTQPLAGSGGIRLHVWKDTLALIASQPITGYGPDSFGAVYPTFQTADWEPGVLFDRPHQEVLEVAATQGLIGVAAYLLIIGALIRTFWRGRRERGAMAMVGALVAYEVTTQVNFSLAPAEIPFLLFLAAAMTIWGGAGRERSVTLKQPALRIAGGAAAVLVATVIAVLAVAHPLVADSQYLVASQAWDNGDTTRARQAVADARTLAPDESAYAILAGDLALDLDNNGVPAADANWQAARQQYEDALRLGTFSPEPFRELARTYRALGLRGQAIATAKRAVLLNRFDPANEAVLVEVSK